MRFLVYPNRKLVLLAVLAIVRPIGCARFWSVPGITQKPPGAPKEEFVFPANISGTYKGSWKVAENKTDNDPQLPFFNKPQGTVVYQLIASSTAVEEVQYLSGEIVFRESRYVTDSDVHMTLEGVYVRRTGNVYVTVQSNFLLPLNASEAATDEAQYRKSLRDSTSTYLSTRALPKGIPINVTAGSRALPAVAEQLRGATDDNLEASQGINLVLKKRCSFQLTGRIIPEGATSRDEWEKVAFEAGGAGEAPPPPHTKGPHDKIVGSGGMLQMYGALLSENCGIQLDINATAIELQAYYNKGINYTLVVTLISLAQVALVIKQMEHTGTQASAAKVSLVTIGEQAIMDAYLCLLHLTVGIVMEQLFNAFTTAAFFEFVMFSLFEMRYMLTIWKARQPPSFDSWASLRRELSLLYSRFYGLLLLGILLLYNMQGFVRWLLFPFFSFWMPQIVRNVVHDVDKPLHPHYILGMSLTRLFSPLYLYGCPHNFVRQMPDYGFCRYLTLYVAAQAALLLLQHRLGPRFFIPARFLPTKYDYFRKTDTSHLAPGDLEAGSGIDCVICMNTVLLEPPRNRMVTPCEHYFHTACLKRWMDIKLECPTCRRPLPPQ